MLGGNKGQSILLTQAILFGFTIFLVYAISSTFVGIRDDYQKFIGENEASELCYSMKGSIDKIYVNTPYVSPTTTVAGYVDIEMPQRISDLPYRARLENRSIVIQSLDKRFNATCGIGLDVNYHGTTSGGLTRFTYTIHANGSKTIEMVKL